MIVVLGLATLLAPYSSRVVVTQVTTDVSELEDFDVVLFDTFGRVDAAFRLAQILDATRAKVLVFSWSPTPDRQAGYVSRGAAGYLSKGATAEELVAALEAVVAGRVLHAAADPEREASGDWPGGSVRLSAREAEILALIVTGLSNQEIAERLYLSINSVKTYIRVCYQKIHVTTRSRAVMWGVANGFMPEERAGPVRITTPRTTGPTEG